METREDGTFVVTKHTGTGSVVTVDTVSEHEMGDPSAYITPDVIPNVTFICVHHEGKD